MSPIQFDEIPHELTEHPHWVLWKYETRKGNTTKVPYRVDGQLAKIDQAATWSPFATVRQAYEAGGYDGIGYVLTANGPYTGIDLDHCFNPETGEISAQAAAILARISSYTEITVSGSGLRIWVRGKLPPGKRRQGDVELYDAGRYFTVSGNRLAGTPAGILPLEAELHALHADLFSPSPSSTPHQAAQKADVAPAPLDDVALIDRALAARNGAKFRELYYGGQQAGSGDHSGDDMALCNLLAFWTGGDRATMDRLFRRSALMRPKWDEKHAGDGRTYGALTLDRATRDCPQHYQGAGDDGYRTLRQAAEALGISRQGVNKRLSRNPGIPTKRTDSGLLLVHLASLKSAPESAPEDENSEVAGATGGATGKKPTKVAPATGGATGKKRQVAGATSDKNGLVAPATGGATDKNVLVAGATSDEVAPLDDDEILTGATPPDDEPGSRAPEPERRIANNKVVWKVTDTGSKPVYYSIPLSEIYTHINALTSDWPKRINNLLFYDRNGDVQFFEKPSDLFAWMNEYAPVSWMTKLDGAMVSYATKEELMSYVTSHAEPHDDIDQYPHYPRLFGHYYAWKPLPDYTPTGEYLDKLVMMFPNVETIHDMALIRAMFCCPAWGGALGQRPAYAIMAPDRGCGKSTLADAVGLLYGGLIDLSINKHAEEEILQRLLTPSARLQRIVRFDNIKGEVNSALLEGLVTATHINGKQMYHGDARRPNTLVFILTGNGLRLSRDMAERCFIIRLVRPEYNPDWQTVVMDYIREHQQRILMDILALLESPAQPTTEKDRWMPFVTHVLSKCTTQPDKVIEINQARRSSADTDIEEAEILFEAVSQIAGEYVGNGWRFVPRVSVVAACNDALNTRLPTRTVLSILREHVAAGRMGEKLICDRTLHGGKRGVMYWKESNGLPFDGANGAQA